MGANIGNYSDASQLIAELLSNANGQVKGKCLQLDELSHVRKRKTQNTKTKQM